MFKLKNKVSGKLLTAGAAIGDPVTEATDTSLDSQKWTFNEFGTMSPMSDKTLVIELEVGTPNIKMATGGLKKRKQQFPLRQGFLKTLADGGLYVNVNGDSVRAHETDEGADEWELIYDTDVNTDSYNFERLTFDKMRVRGAHPFYCEKILPCLESPHQTCGCDNPWTQEPQAIVYFLGAGSKMTEKLDFQSCEELALHGVTISGYFKIQGSLQYCSNDWSELQS